MKQYFFGISPLTDPRKARNNPVGISNIIASTHGIAIGLFQPEPYVKSAIKTAMFATKHPMLIFPNFTFMPDPFRKWMPIPYHTQDNVAI